jgi:polysaccharide pyruvyl transferase WcaK-like protein
MKKVLVLGGDAEHNLGDAAIFEALCCTLRTAAADLHITSVGAGRARATGDLDTTLPRGPRGFSQLLRAVRHQDLVIIGGGGLFQDDDSRIKMPYWALRTALMRALNPRVAGYCLGAGPLMHPDSRAFARWACASMQSISTRDHFAQGWLQRCTSRRIELVPDPAFMLAPAPAEQAHRIIAAAKLPAGRFIGVALRRWFHRRGGWIPHKIRARVGMDRGAGSSHMSTFVSKLADVLERLSKQLECGILLMPSYDLAHEGDVVASRGLEQELRGRVPVGFAEIHSAAEYKAVAGAAQLMVSARMHPLIFAASMGTPIVGLAYNGKFEGLFDLLGLPRRLVWLDEFRDGLPTGRLFEMALDAARDQTDLRARAATLAQQTQRYTASLLCPPAAPGVQEP